MFKKLFKWITNWYDVIFEKYSEEGTAAVRVGNLIKDVIDSPHADIIVALTPTPVDDWLLSRAKRHLLPAIEIWGQSRSIISQGGTKTDAVLAVTDHLKEYAKDARKEFIVSIVADVAVYMSDEKISWGEGLLLTQKIHREKFTTKKQLSLND